MKLLYEDITFKIRGAAFAVYNELGGAFRENVVDKALTIEMIEQGLKVEDQKRIDIFYKGNKVGTYIPDKIVDEKVLVEVKCKPEITKSDEEQFWKYLKGSKYKLGLLINFGPKKLEIKRVIFDIIKNNKSAYIRE